MRQLLISPVYSTYHGVIGKIGGGLVGRRSSRRTLPARDVDSIEELAHLSDHGRLKTSVGVAGLLFLFVGCLVSIYIMVDPDVFPAKLTSKFDSTIPQSFFACTLDG